MGSKRGLESRPFVFTDLIFGFLSHSYSVHSVHSVVKISSHHGVRGVHGVGSKRGLERRPFDLTDWISG